VQSEFQYPAIRLALQKEFHSTLAKLFKSWPLVNHAPSFPYSVKLDDERIVPISLSVVAYYPRILSLRINVEGVVGEQITSLADRPEISNIRAHPDLDVLVQAVLRLIVGEDNMNRKMGYRQFPLMRVEEISSSHFSTWQEHFKQTIARVLIRNDSVGEMRDELIDDLFRKAEHFNFKSSREYLLLDKQGVLMLSSVNEDNANMRLRDATFESAAYLLELGLVYQAFLVNYLRIRSEMPFLADFILSRIQAWFDAPGAVLRVSVTNRKIWSLICEEFNLTELHDLFVSRGYVQRSLRDNMQVFDRLSLTPGRWSATVAQGRSQEFGDTVV
jgi:hypothetical protein